MRFSILFLMIVLTVVSAYSGRRRRQVWSFPDDTNTSTQPQFRPQPQPFPTRTTTTRRQATTSSTTPSSGSTTPQPGIVFQIPDCDCMAPPQYNPVCGSDGVSYVNRQKLECARQCGTNVQVVRMGTCATPRR